MSDEHVSSKLDLGKHYWRRLLTFPRWIWQAGKAWLAFLAIVFATMLPWIERLHLEFWTLEDVFRTTGLLYQLIGFLIALAALNANLRGFNLRSISSRFGHYLAQCPLIPIRKTHNLVPKGMTVGPVIGKPSMTSRSSSEVSFEDRMKNLEDKVERLDRDVGSLIKKHERDISEVMNDVSESNVELRISIGDLRSEISSNVESSVVMEIFGIFLFMVGVVYATIPDTLAGTF